jgi:beta-xylosidase
MPDGSWYGFALEDSGAIGRVTNISPITWQNNWPMWGNANNLGTIPGTSSKPVAGQPIITHFVSSSFDSTQIPLEWQWNHNPDDTRWSLTERPGTLRLKATVAPDFWDARNSLTHKGWGPISAVIADLDISHVQNGDVAGLGMLGKGLVTLAVQRQADGTADLVLSTGLESQSAVSPAASADIGTVQTIQLSLQMNFNTSIGRAPIAWTA